MDSDDRRPRKRRAVLRRFFFFIRHGIGTWLSRRQVRGPYRIGEGFHHIGMHAEPRFLRDAFKFSLDPAGNFKLVRLASSVVGM